MVYDPDADVLVIAKTDLLYEDRRGMGAARDQDHARRQRGQPAGALPAGRPGDHAAGRRNPRRHPGPNRVELERLTPAGPLLDVLDPADPDLHAEACRVIRDMAAGWRADDRAIAVPGPGCRTCEASRWCPDAATGCPAEDDDDH